jgi:hypothetical protein
VVDNEAVAVYGVVAADRKNVQCVAKAVRGTERTYDGVRGRGPMAERIVGLLI